MDINHDLENSPLQIRTDSAEGSSEQVNVNFYATKGDLAGGLSFRFTSPPQYLLGWCTTWINFPADLPTETDKVWTVFYNGTSSEKQMVIYCNKKEVLNTVISASTCTSDSSRSKHWSRDVETIMFPSDSTNTASDYYRQGM